MQTHLTQTRHLLEMLAASFGVWFAAGNLLLLLAGGSPLYWVGWSPEAQADAMLAILAAAVLHVVGINVNGAWRWSPLLRLIGIATHALAVTYLCAAILRQPTGAYGLPSGFVTYSFVSLLLWSLAVGAYRDLLRSLAIWRLRHG